MQHAQEMSISSECAASYECIFGGTIRKMRPHLLNHLQLNYIDLGVVGVLNYFKRNKRQS